MSILKLKGVFVPFKETLREVSVIFPTILMSILCGLLR